MKLLLSFLAVVCAPAFAQSMSGTTWALSGVGCRAASLESSTHISKPARSGNITSGVIHFEDDRNINMLVTDGKGDMSESGTYSVRGDEIKINAKNGAEMTIHRTGKRLIILGSDTESMRECGCKAELWPDWRVYKEEVETHPSRHDGETHPEGTWEEQKDKNNVDEDWLADNEQEFEELKNKCSKFVYVLGKVD